ncbi:universal stress protein [Actinomadura sp. NBRC 104412]|uniref:universal stress protein n=1 Tax=Actinomadura sp. NBRC 104412 TaxID=3032203 RepID=UPI0024A0A32C|nr:universal stress protein [Actinomadura sp. NBRC 104412]GLZ09392.1 universal stress protein [Actinomadura sp. NBRC 104412]
MASGSLVVVGFDGSPESEDAIRWAVREAQLRRSTLCVVHAWRWPYPADYVNEEGAAIVRRTGENLLDRGVELARRQAPDVRVIKWLMDGPAHAALTHEAQGAEMIVVGSHHVGELPVGSTALRLPARADRPVVVVRTTTTRFEQVVVGVDGSAAADAALEFGFEEADLRGWKLRAVYGCWEPAEAPERDLALFGNEDRLREVADGRLKRAVEPWRARYPDVDASTFLRLGSPREAMFEAAESADLVVVGNRGTGGLDPLWLGATSGALLQHAPCTVAIVQARR